MFKNNNDHIILGIIAGLNADFNFKSIFFNLLTVFGVYFLFRKIGGEDANI